MKKVLLASLIMVFSYTGFSQVVGYCSNSGGGAIKLNTTVLTRVDTNNDGTIDSYRLRGEYNSNGNRVMALSIRCGTESGPVVATYGCFAETNGTFDITFPLTPSCAPGEETYINIGVANQNKCDEAKQNSALPSCVQYVILPVELKEFKANKRNNIAALAWTTSMEKNAKEFVLQKKTNGDFVDIATIPAKNEINGAAYSYEDANLGKGVTQYRLKMVDLDGTVKYSTVRLLRGSEAPKFSIYPNPGNANSKITLNESGEAVDVIIFNSNGKVVKQFNNLSDTQVTVGELSTGVYVVKVVNKATGESSNQKLSINK